MPATQTRNTSGATCAHKCVVLSRTVSDNLDRAACQIPHNNNVCLYHVISMPMACLQCIHMKITIKNTTGPRKLRLPRLDRGSTGIQYPPTVGCRELSKLHISWWAALPHFVPPPAVNLSVWTQTAAVVSTRHNLDKRENVKAQRVRQW